MTWKRSILLVAAIEAMVLLVLFVVFSNMKIPLEVRTVDSVRALFPPGQTQAYHSGEWRGYRFPHRFRFLHRQDAPDVNLQNMIIRTVASPALMEPLSLGSEGYYVLRRQAKGYVLFAVFRTNGLVYWLDMVSSSTLDHSRTAFHRCLLSLEIDDLVIDRDALEGQLSEYAGKISPLVIQSATQLLGFFVVLFLAIVAFTYWLISLSGACPRGKMETSTLCTPRVTVTRRGFGSNTSACCLCLEGDQIIAYRFRRPFLTIRLSESRDDLFLENDRIRYKNYTFIMEDDDFHRWHSMVG